MTDTDGVAPQPVLPNTDPACGYTFHLNLSDAMADAETHSERVVVHGGSSEPTRWITCWKAQPLARFLTRGGEVVWQGTGHKGHWDD